MTIQELDRWRCRLANPRLVLGKCIQAAELGPGPCNDLRGHIIAEGASAKKTQTPVERGPSRLLLQGSRARTPAPGLKPASVSLPGLLRSITEESVIRSFKSFVRALSTKPLLLPGPVLGTKDAAVNETGQGPVIMELTFRWSRGEKRDCTPSKHDCTPRTIT